MVLAGQVIMREINKNLKKTIYFFTQFLTSVILKIHPGNNPRFSCQ